MLGSIGTRLSTNIQRAYLSTSTPRQEYPTSFISHLKTQKLNVFNIGIAFITLSLSSQLVSYKQKNEQLSNENELLSARVEELEAIVGTLGGLVPTEKTKEGEIAKEQDAERAEIERVKREREDEARTLVTGSAKTKGFLI